MKPNDESNCISYEYMRNYHEKEIFCWFLFFVSGQLNKLNSYRKHIHVKEQISEFNEEEKKNALKRSECQ